MRFRRERRSVDAFTRNWIQELGIEGFSPDPLTWAAPSMTPAGYPEIGYSANNAVFRWVTDAWQFVDNFSAVRGAHTVKAGSTLQFKRVDMMQWGQPNGAYAFSGQFSAPVPVSGITRQNALADLLLGYPSTYTLQTTPFSPHLSYRQFGAYVQDDWRLSPSVTANLGLRWEYFGRPVERDDRIASFDRATGQQVFPGQDGYPRSLVDADYNNFAPRLGLAWRVNDRMTVRTAYGIFYTPDVINTYVQLAFQQPFAGATRITARPSDPRSPLPVFTVDNPLTQAAALATNNRNGMQRDLRDGEVQQWNTSVQFLLTDRTLLEVAYHGARSAHLMSGLNYNEADPFPPQPPDYLPHFPYPQLGNVTIYESRARSNYRALQARLERRFTNGFSGLVSYTWQRTLTDLDTQQRWRGLRCRSGPADDQGHRRELWPGGVRPPASVDRDLAVCPAVLPGAA